MREGKNEEADFIMKWYITVSQVKRALSRYNTTCCCTKSAQYSCFCDAPWGENEEVAVITQLDITVHYAGLDY